MKSTYLAGGFDGLWAQIEASFSSSVLRSVPWDTFPITGRLHLRFAVFTLERRFHEIILFCAISKKFNYIMQKIMGAIIWTEIKTYHLSSLWPANFKDVCIAIVTNCSRNIKGCWKKILVTEFLELVHVSCGVGSLMW